MHNNNVLLKGKITFRLFDKKYIYSGDIDKNGNAYGFGKAVCDNNIHNTLEGTFLDNKPHGLCT